MNNGYDRYGFRKTYLPNIKLSVEGKKTFQMAKDRIHLCRKHFKEYIVVKVDYAFGDIPEDSIFENPGMDLSLFYDFMTKKEINNLTKEDIILDLEEIQKQLCEQYDEVRNLVISDMVNNNLEKIILKKFNNNKDILYTTNVMTKSKIDENIEMNYILFSRNTEAIKDFFDSVITRSFYEDYIDENFVTLTQQAESKISSLENSKAKRKRMTFSIKNCKE